MAHYLYVWRAVGLNKKTSKTALVSGFACFAEKFFIVKLRLPVIYKISPGVSEG